MEGESISRDVVYLSNYYIFINVCKLFQLSLVQ